MVVRLARLTAPPNVVVPELLTVSPTVPVTVCARVTFPAPAFKVAFAPTVTASLYV